jgi:hypothetical protein
VLGVAVVAVCEEGQAQSASDTFAARYFLDQPPADLDRISPPTAHDIIVAKVRLTQRVSWTGGRHTADPKDVLRTRVEITDVLRGTAQIGAQYNVFFGSPRGPQNLMWPQTPDEHAREYFIVSYLEDDGRRRLAAFPESQDAYERWQNEIREYDRMRLRPGAR